MQGQSYFRRQANTCMRLSESCTDQTLADRFQAMAEDFMAKASEAETGDDRTTLFPHMVKPEGAGGGGIDRN
jgi:hypothetical protein